MKIKGIQIVGEKVRVTTIVEGDAMGAVYVKVNKLDMTVDTNDGSWCIAEDEIISFIKERRKLSD